MNIDKNVENEYNKPILHIAAFNEDIGAINGLLEINYDLINLLDNEGHTALTYSIFNEKYFSSRCLITNGADVV